MALFCVQIDYFAANLALPRMASELHSTAADLQWVISVYMLAYVGRLLVTSGQIGDIFGRRKASTPFPLPPPHPVAGARGRADLSGFGERADPTPFLP